MDFSWRRYDFGADFDELRIIVLVTGLFLLDEQLIYSLKVGRPCLALRYVYHFLYLLHLI